jgi:hypothetical protein
LGQVSVLSQILNIKLSSFTVLERKERKKEDTLLCTGVNRGLLTSVLTSTDILPEFVSVVDMNYDHFGSFSYPPRFSMSVPCVALMSVLFYVLSRIGWLSILCYTVGCHTVLMTINLSGLCRIRYRVFPVRRLYSCLLYSGLWTLFVPIRYTVYRKVLFTCILKIVEWSVPYIAVLCTFLVGALH